MFTEYLKYAKKYGVKLATETFGDAPNFGCVDFFGDISEFLMTYNRICAVDDNAAYMGICADTGHSNKATRFGNPSPADVIRMCGKNLIALHLNDNDTFTDQHKMPLSGSMDWDDIFDALDEVGYSGIYNMELHLDFYGKELIVDTAAFAVKVLRRFLNNRYGRE
jgi:sugar phosphate isomerase/epimerase